MKRAIVFLALATAGSASSAPLFPTITGYDFNFGAYNRVRPTDATAQPEWLMNALLADTLTYTRGSGDAEVTGLWTNWPNGDPDPIFNGQKFGGDFVLNVKFTGQDAPYTNPNGDQIDVSLIGTGADIQEAGVAGADLEIWGTVGVMGNPVLLWSLDLEKVSLYGKSGHKSYVIEGVGKILGGQIAERYQIVGQTGVMRGQADFVGFNGLPALYDPLKDPSKNEYRVAFSGETGVGYAVPEPTTMAGLLLGASVLLLRRRRK